MSCSTQTSLSFTISQSLLRLMSIELVIAIQSSHSLLLPFPLALNLFQHQNLFQWVSSSHQVAKELELQLQNGAEITQKGWFPLGLTGLVSLLSKGCHHQATSPAPQFRSINYLVLRCLYSPTLTTVHDYCFD